MHGRLLMLGSQAVYCSAEGRDLGCSERGAVQLMAQDPERFEDEDEYEEGEEAEGQQQADGAAGGQPIGNGHAS